MLMNEKLPDQVQEFSVENCPNGNLAKVAKFHTNPCNFLACLPNLYKLSIGHFRNVRGLGKSMVVFRLFEKLKYSNERSTIFQSLNHEQKYSEEENVKMVALQISPKIESLYGLGRQAKKLQGFVWNFATFARFPFEQFSTETS